MLKVTCNKCGHNWEFNPPMGRGDECPKCHWDSHVCLNCKHYDKNFHHECRESQAEYVQVKDRSNFCDYFEPLVSSERRNGDDATRKKLDALFGGIAPSNEVESKERSIADELQAFLKNKGR